jgi:hypothetical protein
VWWRRPPAAGFGSIHDPAWGPALGPGPLTAYAFTMNGPPHLRVIPGGRREVVRVGQVEVRAGPPSRPPFPVDAVVLEDDTWRVLGASTRPQVPTDAPLRIHTGALDAEPLKPGSVRLGRGIPARIHAIVHDLDAEVTLQRQAVAEALRGVVALSRARGYVRLAMPVLGTVHGDLPEAEALSLLRDALRGAWPGFPARVWLVVRPGSEARVLATLAGDPGS